jgi:hypothetical protein
MWTGTGLDRASARPLPSRSRERAVPESRKEAGRMTFKECIRSDVTDVFLNLDEFAVEHTINGKKMRALVDNNELIEREKKAKSDMDGVNTKQTLIYVWAREFGGLPPVGYMITLDGMRYIVTDAINEDGVYSITVEANRH